MLQTLLALRNRLATGPCVPPDWTSRRERALHLLALLSGKTGAASGQNVSLGFVPGRIEVFGRHTDYAGGRTLVCSIEQGFLFAAAPSSVRRIRLFEDSTEFRPVEFDLDQTPAPPVGQWANYPMTMARRLGRNFPGQVGGVDIFFSSTLPSGSGMSSSSALMMMVFTAIASAYRIQENAAFKENIRNAIDLSVYLACAENGQSFRALEGDAGVGTFGGSEDHAAILNARPGCLSLFGFSPPELLADMPWPPDWRMVVAFSGVRAEKTGEALDKYNMASRRVRDSVAKFNALAGTRLSSLRDVVNYEPKPGGSRWLAALARAPGDASPDLPARVRQFMLEDGMHIPGALDALRAADLRAFGRLVSASHRASKKYLWNIVPEIDFLRSSACRLGAAGASGFGAGFGGSIYAVTTVDRAEELIVNWRERYAARYPRLAAEAAFFIAQPGPGIEVWTDSGPVRFADAIFQV
jgi:galactokinase